MEKLKVAVLASTNATSSQSLIETTKRGKINAEIVCFISNKESCGAMKRAKLNNIPAIFVDPKGKSREEFDIEVMEVLLDKSVDLVLLIGYMRILSPKFVQEWGDKTMNIHPSLLPAFAGGMDKNVHQEVLDKGVKVTGCTLHFITEEADEGPIIAQKAVDIASDETVDSLKDKVQEKENEVIVEAVQLFSEGRIKVEGDKVIINK